MSAILQNREWQVEGDWCQPQAFLNGFRSVQKAHIICDSSSAGDWDGFFFQQIGKCRYAIPFRQENNWPNGSGFTLTTYEAMRVSQDLTIEQLVKLTE